jgi:predicted NAD/FAD-binding protein
MKIAIIGGGSAGLVTAHLLDGVHEITVFEKASILGGHVRTLNRNVDCELDPDLVLDAGVIEFERGNFPTLIRLFEKLGCEMRRVPGTTTFWSHEGEHFLSPGSIRLADQSLVERLSDLIELIAVRLQEQRFSARSDLPEHQLRKLSLGELLTESEADRWAALLATYAYSIPYDRVREMPAGLTIPMLRAFSNAEDWVSLVGGSWDYLRRIVARFSGAIYCDAHIAGVRRHPDRVCIRMRSGEVLEFDKVVFATPPDQVLVLLEDPSEAELRRFGSWKANHIHTLVHRDRGIYQRRGVKVMTEFDVIETGPRSGGYNCHLNALCGVPEERDEDYGLAFGLDEWIDPECVVLRQEHHTPDYTVEAHRWHVEVSQTNGENRTFHAGAWLGDGLQEGAVTSAEAVSKLLGGASIV